MVAKASVRPYRYEGPYPLSGSGIRPFSYSGILFEQAMYALNQEEDIYTSGLTKLFTKYINKGAAISSTFTPNATGTNLSSGGNVHFRNYITDLRTKFSGLFSKIEIDSPYAAAEILLDYFKRNTGDNASGSVGNWIHSLLNLGERGDLYDIDLREVSYQPYIRVSKYQISSTSGFSIPCVPVGPTFCSRFGHTVNVTARDVSNAAQMGQNALFAYSAASLDKLVIAGDIFEPNNSKLYVGLTPTQLLNSATGTCTDIGARILTAGASLIGFGSGYGFFTIPTGTLPSGIYSIQIFNSNPVIAGYYTPKSGIVGIWPRLSELVTSGYIRATATDGLNQIFTSGIHVFNTGFFQFTTSGALILSPINGAILWYRFVDNSAWSTANFGPKHWYDLGGLPATPIVGANDKLCFSAGMTADLNPNPIIADIRFVFVKYDPSTFDLIGGIEEAHSIPSPESPPSIDRFFFIYGHTPTSGVNLSNCYAITEIATLSSGPEFYVLNISLENIGAWDNGTNPSLPICMMNGHLYGFDPNQAGSSGATFLWTHDNFADPGGVFPMNPASVGVVDTQFYVYETRDTVYDPNNNFAALFEPLNPNNFGFGGLPIVIDPRGTDLDYGDGSVLVRFNAKMKGETTTKQLIGRIKEGTVAGNPVIVIFEFTPVQAGGPNWLYGIV